MKTLEQIQAYLWESFGMVTKQQLHIQGHV